MKLMPKENRVRIWLAIVGTASILLVAAYAMVQQSTRLSANDLPLATAQTIKHELEGGESPADVVPQVKTDSLTDDTVFAIITDANHQVLASSLNDPQSVRPPQGVFDYAAVHGEDNVTWQTGAGARLATIVIPYKSGFIVTGQSLNQAEKRVTTYTLLMLVAWLVILGWTFMALWFYL